MMIIIVVIYVQCIDRVTDHLAHAARATTKSGAAAIVKALRTRR